MASDHAKRRRSARGGLTVLLSAALLVTGLPVFTAASRGQTAFLEPQIALLNPSSFSEAGSRGIIVSDLEPDSGPGCCDAATGAYRLSAWVANAPSDASVFFLVTQSPLEFEIVPDEKTENNSWIADWDVPPEVLDGPATIAAFLVQGEQVLASDETDVTIMTFQEASRITHPSLGGSFGTFSPLANTLPAEGAAERKAPMGVVDALYTGTAKITWLRTFYTTSAPGQEPEWKVCATETATASGAGNGSRCALQDPADQGAITAVASVANDSPDTYDETFNQSGDAVPVGDPYVQVPTQLALGGTVFEEVGKVEGSDRFSCSGNQTVTLTDQLGRAIPGANIDVHATGPTDGLKFHTFAILTVNQPPNRGTGHTTEPGFDCTGQSATLPPSNANPSTQGEHQRFGAPDRKHIEARAGGTNDLGTFSFRFHSNAVGNTNYTAWLDESDDGCLVDDDNFTAGEMNVSGSVAFGQQAAPAQMEPFEPLFPCVPGTDPDPDPDPEPSPSPTDDPNRSGQRTINLRSTSSSVSRGDRIKLKGRIRADEAECSSVETVKLKKRRPGRRFHTIDESLTGSSGRFAFKVTVNGDTDYRVVAVPRGFCEKARSTVLRIRAG